MSFDHATVAQIAEHLENAELQARNVTRITEDYPHFDCDDAYAVQKELRRRKESRGQRTVGLKIGVTSHAKMTQLDIDTPVFGFVSDYMACVDGSDIRISELIQPMVEAAICFVTKAPLKGPGCHVGAVLAATDFVIPAIEVIDSRYHDFKFDLNSVIADNASASRFVVGTRQRDAAELDLRTLGVVLEKNGEIVALGAGAAVLGHPAAAISLLADKLGREGAEIPAGTFIMTGGLTEAIPVTDGDAIHVRFQELGSVSMRFV